VFHISDVSLLGWRDQKRSGPAKAGRSEELIPHSSFLRRSFVAPTRTHGGANESGSGKCSDSWLLAGLSPGNLLPAFTSGTFGDWQNGESYPVTAAQLLPVFTEFLPSIH
jgi:hypothetical protein